MRQLARENCACGLFSAQTSPELKDSKMKLAYFIGMHARRTTKALGPFAFLLSLLSLVAHAGAAIAQGMPHGRATVERALEEALDALELGTYEGRDYGVHVPPNADGPLPVLLVLHGAGRGFAGIAARTEFHNRGARAIIVYPNGTSATVQGRTRVRWDPYSQRGDDIGYIRGLIEAINARHPVDTNRIYATGMSAGAAMVESLGCQMPGIAGIAPVAASISTRAYDVICNKPSARPVAFIGFMGTVDRNGEAAKYDASVDLFARRAGCTARYQERRIPGADPDGDVSVTLRIAEGRNAEPCPTPVHHYRIEGGGHFWPGAYYAENALRRQAAEGAGHAERLDATGLILDFFGLTGG